MSIVEVLGELGGIATWGTLRRLVRRAAIDRAVAAGDVVVIARGRYALPTAQEAAKAATRLAGAVSHRSAAAHWGWAQKSAPDLPEVTVPNTAGSSGTVGSGCASSSSTWPLMKSSTG